MHGRWKVLKRVDFLLSILQFNSNLHADHKTFIFWNDIVRQTYKEETGERISLKQTGLT